MKIDSKIIRELAQLLEETNLSEIEVQDKEHRLKVVRYNAPPAFIPQSSPLIEKEVPPLVVNSAQKGNPSKTLTSPMVGTVYLSPKPGDAPYVKVGDLAKKGQTLLIIEAMKVMNPILAPHDGKVVDILIEDGAAVEYGEMLIKFD
jgi:acetyl-CoA carboxylase biotin carboxyl carrier protein